MAFHLTSIQLEADQWPQIQGDVVIKALGKHFSGETQYGTQYEFVLRQIISSKIWECLRWTTIEIVRGSSGTDRTTTTHYTRAKHLPLT